jgi:hypothetical protein
MLNDITAAEAKAPGNDAALEPETPPEPPYSVTWEDSVPADWEENGIGVSY